MTRQALPIASGCTGTGTDTSSRAFFSLPLNMAPGHRVRAAGKFRHGSTRPAAAAAAAIGYS